MLSTLILFSLLYAAHSDYFTPDQQCTLLCVEEVVSRHFQQGQPLVISMPSVSSEVSSRTMNHTHSAATEFKLVDQLLENTHKRTNWPVLTSRPDIDIAETNTTYKHQSYIVLLWPDDTEDYTLSTLQDQLEHMTGYVDSLNRRGRFLVVVTHFGIQSGKTLAMNITEILHSYKISNSLIMIPTALQSNPATNETEYGFDLYTWFPYRPGQCGELEVVFLERCVLGKDVYLPKNISLFPSKIPLNVNGCPIRVFTWEHHPNVILREKYKKEDGNTIYEYTGLEIEYLRLLSEAINMTIEFIPPPICHLSDCFFLALTSVVTGKADITLGNFPLNYLAAAYCEPTVAHAQMSFKWYVPCAKPVRRVDNIINLFTASVWLALVLVLILSAVLLWGVANRSWGSMTQESTTYKTLSQSFSNVWAVLMGISVAEMPRTFRLRSFFFIFVCYCFAINTIFQAFFTSFLIEPIYVKQIETLGELKRSGVEFLEHPSLEDLAFLINYDEHTKLQSRQDCPNYTLCMYRLLEGHDVSTLCMDLYAEYVASSEGWNENGKKSLCSINKPEFSMGLSMYLSKGDLLVDRFNILIQRCLEAGLGYKYWTQLNWNASVSRYGKRDQDHVSSGNDMYFAFTTNHLRVAFCILGFGSALSSIVFVAELLSKTCFTRAITCLE